MVAILGVVSIGHADERPRLRRQETPRATDLLRAKRMADRVGSRLRPPPTHVEGWAKGGTGWGSAPASPAAREPDVVINLQPRRRRRTARDGLTP